MQTTKENKDGFQYEQGVNPTEGLMTQRELDETKSKLAKLGPEGSKERDCAFQLMELGTLLNKYRFHNQEDKMEYCSSAEQFLFQLKAVKVSFGLNNARINDGLNWLRENGFDYLHGLSDILLIAQEAYTVLQKRPDYLAEAKKLTKAKEMTEKEADRKMKRELKEWVD